MELSEKQKQMLQNRVMGNGMTAWEYIHLFDDDKRVWVAAGILSCIEQDLSLRPEIISNETGHLKYGECKITELTEQQKKVCLSPDFLEDREKGRRFQEFLPPYTIEEVIGEMKARGQYRTTGWIL